MLQIWPDSASPASPASQKKARGNENNDLGGRPLGSRRPNGEAVSRSGPDTATEEGGYGELPDAEDGEAVREVGEAPGKPFEQTENIHNELKQQGDSTGGEPGEAGEAEQRHFPLRDTLQSATAPLSEPENQKDRTRVPKRKMPL